MFKPHLASFTRQSYVHGDTWERLRRYGIEPGEVIDCSLGINPYGCSPMIAKEIRSFNLEGISQYPDPYCTKLQEAIVEYWGYGIKFSKDNIFMGAGSMGVLEMINKAFLGTQSTVLGYCPQFTEYITEVKACGGKYEYVPLKAKNNFKFSSNDFLFAIDRVGPDLVYLDNPNNPTGQIIDLAEIEKIVKAAQAKGAIAIVDEAYGDYMEDDNSAMNIAGIYDNLIVVRSFSKGLGLAGARVGYAVVGNALKDDLGKVELPFKVTNMAGTLAIKALQDREFIRQCRQKNRENKARIIKDCENLFHVAETSLQTPILTLGALNEEIDLYEAMLTKGILTEAGHDFINLGKNYVRIRVPVNADTLLERIIELGKELC